MGPQLHLDLLGDGGGETSSRAAEARGLEQAPNCWSRLWRALHCLTFGILSWNRWKRYLFLIKITEQMGLLCCPHQVNGK